MCSNGLRLEVRENGSVCRATVIIVARERGRGAQINKAWIRSIDGSHVRESAT